MNFRIGNAVSVVSFDDCGLLRFGASVRQSWQNYSPFADHAVAMGWPASVDEFYVVSGGYVVNSLGAFSVGREFSSSLDMTGKPAVSSVCLASRRAVTVWDYALTAATPDRPSLSRLCTIMRRKPVIPQVG